MVHTYSIIFQDYIGNLAIRNISFLTRLKIFFRAYLLVRSETSCPDCLRNSTVVQRRNFRASASENEEKKKREWKRADTLATNKGAESSGKQLRVRANHAWKSHSEWSHFLHARSLVIYWKWEHRENDWLARIAGRIVSGVIASWGFPHPRNRMVPRHCEFLTEMFRLGELKAYHLGEINPLLHSLNDFIWYNLIFVKIYDDVKFYCMRRYGIRLYLLR